MGDNVVVTRQHEHLFILQQILRMGSQPVHPPQLVRVLLRVDRIAVWQINRANAHNIFTGRNERFYVACLLITLVAR